VKVYVAAKWEERERASLLMFQLYRFLGCTITYDWTKAKQISPEQAEHDLHGVASCDILLFIATEKLAYTGALAELGAALALGKRVIVIGTGADACIFTHHPCVERVSTTHGALALLAAPVEPSAISA
jgi:nucleoside 2-deoxyribosyltransferase